MTSYLFILGTIVFTVAGQIILKYGMPTFGSPPSSSGEMLPYLFRAATSIYFISSLSLALIAAFCWIIALSKFELSFAYPFMSLSFVLVVLFSWMLFAEQVSLVRWLGVMVICLGVFLISRS